MGRGAIQAEGRRDKHAINITTPHIFPIFISHFSEAFQRNKGRFFMMLGCGSMKVVAGWFKGNYDAYFEAYEVDDEEFWRVLEEVSDDDPDRDLAYHVRGRGRLMCRIEPSYTIIINDAR
jgi:hypothetical protein